MTIILTTVDTVIADISNGGGKGISESNAFHITNKKEQYLG
jgi:hypothetical protein